MKKKLIVLLFGSACLLLMTLLAGCSLPSYNFSSANTPASATEDFIRAVISGSDSDVNEFLYNFTWNDDDSAESLIVSESDIKIYHALKQSRSFEPVSRTDIIDSHNAEVTVRYTTFDISKYRSDVSEHATKFIKDEQYNGVKFETAADTAVVIDRIKLELLENPSKYYTTKDFKLSLINVKGKWKVILSDEFYNALLGYGI